SDESSAQDVKEQLRDDGERAECEGKERESDGVDETVAEERGSYGVRLAPKPAFEQQFGRRAEGIANVRRDGVRRDADPGSRFNEHRRSERDGEHGDRDEAGDAHDTVVEWPATFPPSDDGTSRSAQGGLGKENRSECGHD